MHAVVPFLARARRVSHRNKMERGTAGAGSAGWWEGVGVERDAIGTQARSGMQRLSFSLSLFRERSAVVYVAATDFIANYVAAKRKPLITRLLTLINHAADGL